tara:strand:- start:36 stop:1916 length:1881 start_codon:yes stop_codon:yes gene_type:complete
MKKFNIIKKSRKKSTDIDEKIEYLNRECRKNGLLSEIMTTTNMYSTINHEPNPLHVAFTNSFLNGEHLGFSGAEYQIYGNLISGVAYSPPHPSTGERTRASTYRGLGSGFGALIPGYRKTPQHRQHGGVLWYFANNEWNFLEWSDQHNTYCSWATNFIGFPYMVPATGANSPLSSDLKNALNNLNIQSFIPDEVGPPTNPVLFQNDLGDPSFLPIDIKGISSQAFDWLKDKAQDALDLLSNPFEPVLDLLADLTGTSAEKDNVDDYMRNFIPDLLAGNEPIGSTPDNPRDNSEVYDAETISDYEEIFQDYQSEINGEKDSLDISWEAKYNLAQRDNSSIGNTTGTLDPEAGDGFIDNGDGTVTLRKAFDFDRYDDMAGSNLATTLGAMGYGIMSGIPGLLYRSGGKTPTMYTGITFNKKTGKVIKNYKPNIKESLDESVKLGHFEPEVLTVDIEKLRKGIVPEFPKDPPPEMIGGYSAKSRLVRKEPELPPFIKVTKKDLARNHRLTDKEISDFMNDVNMINDYIKKNPAELKYAMIRYPKDDPRLAQLNFKMDQMKAASDEYMNTHFPENQKLFSKLQNKIIRNISQTDPKNFTGHKDAPKFVETDITDIERRRKTIIRHFKKKK